MDMANPLNEALITEKFGSERIILSTRDRPHTSISMLKPMAKEIKQNEATKIAYADMEPSRYIIAQDVIFDALISLYDVNSSSLFAARLTFHPDGHGMSAIKHFVSSLKRPNLEMRLIGLQNGAHELVKVSEEIRKSLKAQLVEVDIFGKQMRHIAFDAKTGLSYDLLLLDRIYRPGELNNMASSDKMVASSKLKLV